MKADFGRELLTEINKGYDPVRIAKWAFARSMSPDIEIESKDLYALILTVVAMEEGPQFEYSEQELRELAEQLTMSN